MNCLPTPELQRQELKRVPGSFGAKPGFHNWDVLPICKHPPPRRDDNEPRHFIRTTAEKK